ncbi:hypothetical protein [Photobacterium sp. GSS17]|uniref:hypothetical protein n=1 Tax=Photobacterium sp. GSS17 TaxID=3020715 RepID=UPI00235E5340|nr:hypothetical protein [Photobacterium sp. GSS17]
MSSFTRYLERINSQSPTLAQELGQIVNGIKQTEAQKINQKGIESQVNYLHSQGMGYDEILMGLGCSAQEAQALIQYKDMYPPLLKSMRQWLHRHIDGGAKVGKLIDGNGRVIDVGIQGDLGVGFNRHYDRGRVLSCCKTRISSRDLLWLANEPWWKSAPLFELKIRDNIAA